LGYIVRVIHILLLYWPNPSTGSMLSSKLLYIQDISRANYILSPSFAETYSESNYTWVKSLEDFPSSSLSSFWCN